MSDVITIGDAMIAFNPTKTGPMRYVNTFEKNIGGAELNVAIGCSRLGLSTSWISRLGKDEFGTYIKTFARGENIDVSQVKLVEGTPTSLNFKEIMPSGDVRTFYYRENSPTLTMKPEELDEEAFKSAKVLHLTSIFPAIDDQNLAITKQAIKLAKDHGVKVVFDPNIRLKLWTKEKAREVILDLLPDVDLLIAGDEEMKIIVGESDPDRIQEKCQQFDFEYLIIKRGENGATGFHQQQKAEVKANKVKSVVDTVGAGDGFDAGFIYSYLNGYSLEKALHFANTIGGMVVEVIGDNEGLPYLEEVQMHMGEIERIER
ncbi:sugar kinase [Halalkalibacillus halophilus]|uniref:sugar kinase n=1 Tax=Halalkalibacillus halophilus TaxID=392827 RepID=UPI000429FFDE|nr:sugar kinase [Halalkalibacillus halophilus]